IYIYIYIYIYLSVSVSLSLTLFLCLSLSLSVCLSLSLSLSFALHPGGLDSSNTSWAWPGRSDWQFANPGETIIADCKNCTCEAGVLHCQSVPGCHVDGGWSQWGGWSECSAPCGGGVKLRMRQCDNPAPQSGGRGCAGMSEQQRECNNHTCTDSGLWPTWSPWSSWSVCSVSCGGGEQSRTRLCSFPPALA
ncbi:unnamed protein product, partial [Oncorhynchus mykiss]